MKLRLSEVGPRRPVAPRRLAALRSPSPRARRARSRGKATCAAPSTAASPPASCPEPNSRRSRCTMGGKITTTDRIGAAQARTDHPRRSTPTAGCRPRALPPARSASSTRSPPRKPNRSAAMHWSATATSPPGSPCRARGPSPRTPTCSPSTARSTASPAVFAQVSSRSPAAADLRDRLRSQEGQGAPSAPSWSPPCPRSPPNTATSPPSTSRSSRQYESHGKKLSYASASCPAPKGFPGATFPFVKASYEFADGSNLEATLVRECKVRGN